MRRTMRRMAGMVLAAALLTTIAVAAQARPWLGVVTQSVDGDLRESLDLRDDGVLVNRVVPDSPADRAGIRKGDVIVRFDGHDVSSPSELVDLVGDQNAGESVSLVVWRDGARRELSARLAEREDAEMNAPEPPDAPEAPEAPRAPRAPRSPNAPDVRIKAFRNGKPVPEAEARRMLEGFGDMDHFRVHVDGDDEGDSSDDSGDDGKRIERRIQINGLDGLQGLEGLRGLDHMPGVMATVGRGRLGVRVEELSPDLASALGASGTRGALVLEVIKDTPAERAGIKAGDVIVELDGKPVYDTDDIRGALPKDAGRVSVSLVRRGMRRTVEASVDAAPRTMTWRQSGPMGLGRTGDDRVKVFRRSTPGAQRDQADVRDELRQLREQLRDLREQLEEMKR